ncbi:hypothetical protein LF1_56290 [Rubripirellula obstinata]|uniref:Plasmid stabilization system protein n=1 Tax=Rubripirellula obstinata TaxID=406547 RepID=A0A5B1C7K0_9BACT|nr:hypothetical protein [Rubripirellula obstinata]KAA1257067.1 hypothetical protein LF1_56290 [Rubripirellula obstinata]
MNARLTAYTESDLLRGIDWFDRLSMGLGDKFEIEFYSALERVKAHPESFAPDHTGYRPCRLNRFTAVLYFRIDAPHVVVVGLFTSGEDERELQNRG